MKKRSTTARKSSSQKESASGPTLPAKPVRSPSVAEAASSGLEIISIPPAKSKPPSISNPAAMREVRFGYFQPDAREVFVVGSFNGWNPRATPLKRDALGDWSVQLQLPAGEYHYRLQVDGEWRDDPSAQQTSMNPYGGFDAVIAV